MPPALDGVRVVELCTGAAGPSSEAPASIWAPSMYWPSPVRSRASSAAMTAAAPATPDMKSGCCVRASTVGNRPSAWFHR